MSETARVETVCSALAVVARRHLTLAERAATVRASPLVWRAVSQDCRVVDLRKEKRPQLDSISPLQQWPAFRGAEEMDFTFAPIDDEWLGGAFGGHRWDQLRIVNLDGCQKVTNSSLGLIAAACPQLAELRLYWNLKVDDDGIDALFPGGPRAPLAKSLRVLCLSGCKKVTDAGVMQVLTSCGALVELDITRCPLVTDKSLHLLSTNSVLSKPTLQYLCMYACAWFTAPALVQLRHLPALTRLELTGCAVSDKEMNEITSACPDIKHLNLTWCVLLTDKSICHLASALRSVEYLSVFGNTNVTPAILEALQSHASGTLHTLDINGCSAIDPALRTPDRLRTLFPRLVVFKVHS